MLSYIGPMANVITFPERLYRVLVIDADPSTAANVRDALAKVSPRVRVHRANSLGDATARLFRDEWNLVVLKPWQAQPGKPLPISIIRKCGYRGPVIPVTAGGPAINRIPAGQRPAPASAQKPIIRYRNKAMNSMASGRPSVSSQVSQLLDEAFTGA